MIVTTAILTSALLGGILYRFRGGWPDMPRIIEYALFCSIFAIAPFVFDVHYAYIVLAYGLSIWAIAKGHGHTMTYITPVDVDNLEDYEFFTKGLIGKVSDYWYKFIAHGFGGFLMSAASGLMIMPISFSAGLVIALSGFLKAPAYAIGWLLHPNHNDGKAKLSTGKFTLNGATEWGEFLTGAFIWGAIAITAGLWLT